jgi:hypothetical protein
MPSAKQNARHAQRGVTQMNLRVARFGGMDLTRPAGQGLGGKHHWYSPRLRKPHLMAINTMVTSTCCIGIALWGTLTPDWCQISTRLSLNNPTADVDINDWKSISDKVREQSRRPPLRLNEY